MCYEDIYQRFLVCFHPHPGANNHFCLLAYDHTLSNIPLPKCYHMYPDVNDKNDKIHSDADE